MKGIVLSPFYPYFNLYVKVYSSTFISYVSMSVAGVECIMKQETALFLHECMKYNGNVPRDIHEQKAVINILISEHVLLINSTNSGMFIVFNTSPF